MLFEMMCDLLTSHPLITHLALQGNKEAKAKKKAAAAEKKKATPKKAVSPPDLSFPTHICPDLCRWNWAQLAILRWTTRN